MHILRRPVFARYLYTRKSYEYLHPNRRGEPAILARQAEFRRRLDTLSSWQERARKIDERLKQTTAALATRNEKLLALREDFDAHPGFLGRVCMKRGLRESRWSDGS
jgi:hypothetical protein